MILNYQNFTQAWEQINELFISAPLSSFKTDPDRVLVSNALYFYNVIITVDNPQLDPEFDFGRHFNYTKNKWNNLVGNYICLEELKEFKSNISSVLNSKKPFNIPYLFKNKHANGKNCLLNMIATRRYGSNEPYLTFTLRASEVTKRLAVDFLLAQRIGEYLFEDKAFKVVFMINQMFNDDTVLLMYHAHRDTRPLLNLALSKYKTLGKDEIKRLRKMEDRLKAMLTGVPSDYSYKVHLRAFKVLRPDLYKYPKTLAKDCKLPL